MSDFGGKLREARERRGLSLRQIADRTKISIAALEALERCDVSKLPGGIFSRAFVRSYAIEVGLDPDESVHEFLERFQGTPAVQVSAPAAISENDSTFEIDRRILGLALKAALVAVPLIGVVLYLTLRTRPVDRGRAIGSPSGSGPAASEPAAATSPRPVSFPPAPAAPVATVATAATVPGVMRLELHPTGDCWVKLTVDGRTVLAKLMAAGDKEVRQVRDTATIEVGDAGAFAFSIDGRPGKRLGQSGQIRTVRITKQTLSQYLE